ncbi:hypothetical protein D3C81_2304810 [compost metagenome]
MCLFMLSIIVLQFFIMADISCIMSIIDILPPSIIGISFPFIMSELSLVVSLGCSAKLVEIVPIVRMAASTAV